MLASVCWCMFPSLTPLAFLRAETESGFPDCLLSQMPQLVAVAGLQKTGIKRARTAMPQVCAWAWICLFATVVHVLMRLRLPCTGARGS